MKTSEGIFICNICQEPIIEEKDDGLHYIKVDYHVHCVVERLRAKKAIPEAVANEKCVETEAVA